MESLVKETMRNTLILLTILVLSGCDYVVDPYEDIPTAEEPQQLYDDLYGNWRLDSIGYYNDQGHLLRLGDQELDFPMHWSFAPGSLELDGQETSGLQYGSEVLTLTDLSLKDFTVEYRDWNNYGTFIVWLHQVNCENCLVYYLSSLDIPNLYT